MNIKEQKSRNEIDGKFKWNISAMYEDDSLAIKDLEESINLINKFSSLQGKISLSSLDLLKSLELYFDANRKFEKAYVYSHLRKDEDNSNPKFIELFDKAQSTLIELNAKSSFFIPELLENSYDKILKYIKSEPKLNAYKFIIDEIFLQKPHTLSKEEEYILASLNEVLDSSDEIFSILNDVDFNFGTITNSDGIDEVLTHGNFQKFMKSNSRDVRKSAYEKLYTKYKKYNNTLASTLSLNVKKNVQISKLRKYNSVLEAALAPSKIDLDVYNNLINVVHEHIPSLQKYFNLKKEYLHIDDFKMYDSYIPLINESKSDYSFEDAISICMSALKPLGEDYTSLLYNGLVNERWVDIYENKGKTSGAFSFSSYDSYPYILMNFSSELQDVFTLIHESGHSMHSLYTNKNQPYQYASHSIFTAEVASTVNETFLIRYLLKNCESKQEKAYLLNFYIDEFKSTLFRQTMFAEFEKIIHEKVELGETLTAEYLNNLYKELNDFYYGYSVKDDDMIKYEWSRIPHFYNSFYVYQYATGYSAANAIVNNILSEGPDAAKKYKNFLKTGTSNYPIELLKIAGVDMASKEPINSALNTFDKLVSDFEKELKGTK